MEIVLFAFDGIRLLHLHGPLDNTANSILRPSWKNSFDLFQTVLYAWVSLFSVWAMARGWSGFAEPAARDQFSASPLTLGQLLAARIYLWILPLIAINCLIGIIVMGEDILVICFAEEDSYIWYRQFWALKPEGPRAQFAITRTLIHLPIGALGSWFLVAALAARVTCLFEFRWLVGFLATILVGIASILFLTITGEMLFQALYPKIGSPWSLAVKALLGDFLLCALGLGFWWGLRQQVARAVGRDLRLA